VNEETKLAVARYLPNKLAQDNFFKVTAELQTSDLATTLSVYEKLKGMDVDDTVWAALGLVDRFFLLAFTLGRKDLVHPWLYLRCREVEKNPDDHLDLWARGHYKSTIITYAGTIQAILLNPEITIGIFSHTRPIAKSFLRQIKRELEGSAKLKQLYPDVVWTNEKREAPKWSEDDGVVVRRNSNPKEATVEAWGLVDGQPTGRHFQLRIYDDVVTRESVTTPDMVKKTTEAWELSDNLGIGDKSRVWTIGTRYHLADTYHFMLERGVFKERIYAATNNGKLDGKPVFLSPEEWERKKKTQPTTISAQMLQNPAAGNESMFDIDWLRTYEIRPTTLNVYIMCDPSKGSGVRSDRTAFAVIGVDSNLNKYLLDGYRHRMNLSERWNFLKLLRRRWIKMPGVVSVHIGYERYGMQSDIEHFQAMMKMDNEHFEIKELAWPRSGGGSKQDRVERLIPDMLDGRFFLPVVVWHEAYKKSLWKTKNGVVHYTSIDDKHDKAVKEKRKGKTFELAEPIKRIDEEKKVYDLTRDFIEECVYFPFGVHDDLIDCVSRIYDMEPTPPKFYKQAYLEPDAFFDS
jgi:hypothetical protein